MNKFKKNILVVLFLCVSALFFVFMQNCSSGGGGGTPAGTVQTNAIILVSSAGASINVIEGANIAFTFKLSSQPTSSINVSLISNNTSSVVVSPTSITFNSSNWNLAQTVTLSAIADVNVVNETVLVSAFAVDLPTAALTVNVSDTDTLSIFTDANAYNVNEGNSSAARVRLTAQPAASVVVNISSANTAAVTVAPNTLTFTPGNWNVLQSLNLTAEQDANYTNESVNIQLTSAGVVTKTVTANTVDDDIFALTATSATNNGGGGTVTCNDGSGSAACDSYPSGTTVTLTANANSASNFVGWSGGACVGTGVCIVTINAATNITANFSRPVLTIVVSVGAGAGTVYSTVNGGLACTADTCLIAIDKGTVFTLTTNPFAVGSVFNGWSGSICVGTGSCSITITADSLVGANFN